MSTLPSNQTKHKQFKLNQLNFAIPLMAIAGLLTLGIFAINQDVDYDASATTTPVNSTVSYDDEYITISSSSAIDLNHDKVVTDSTSVYTTDNVTVSTNVSTGYELYLTSGNKTTSALTSTTTSDSIAATSGTGGELGTPAVLDDNSYGYAVPSGKIGNTSFDSDYSAPGTTSKWAGVPAGTSDRIRSTNSANESGDTVDIHYAANLNNAITPGTYTGQVTYSAVVTPTSNTVTMTSTPKYGSPTKNTTLTITSGPTTINTAANLSTDEVKVYLRQNGTTKATCNVTSVDVSSGKVITTCTAPTFPSGSYDITITIPRYGFKDMVSNGFIIPTLDNITNMQDENVALACQNSTTTTSVSEYKTYELTDIRDSKKYYVRKLGSFCIMVENLSLSGGTTITGSDSNVYDNDTYTLPESKTTGFNNSNPYMYNGVSRYRNTNSGNDDGAYYSYSAAIRSSGTYDICPKYWHVPTISDYYSLSSTISTIGTVNVLFAGQYGAPRSVILSGYYLDNQLASHGSEAWWWISQFSSSLGSTIVFSANSSSSLNGSNPRNAKYGFSIRCLVQAAS